MNEAKTAPLNWAKDASNSAVADHIADIVSRPGAKRIALPGGSTPIPIFAELARHELNWDEVTLMLTDDRQVPLDHEASNQARLNAAFADSGAAIAPLQKGQEVKHFDLVWLGMGADGHIASLFPQMRAEDRDMPTIIATRPEPLPPEAPFARLSLNMAALVNSAAIMLVIRGEEKKRVLEAAIAGKSDVPMAQLLRQARCPLTIFWSPS